MGAFADGFKNAGDMWDSNVKNELAKKEMAMRQEAHAQSIAEGGLRISRAKREDDATGALTSGVANGISDPRAQQANNDAFDAYDQAQQRATLSQNAMRRGAGSQSDYDINSAIAGGLSQAAPVSDFRKASDREINSLGMRAAAARGQDVGGYMERDRAFTMRDITARGAKYTPQEITDKFPGLNSEAMSGLPIYDAGDVLGSGGKRTGYRELKIVKDGKTELIQVSPLQQRQMAIAYDLLNEGFASEGMAALAGVNKDMGDLVSKYNATISGAVKVGNDATHQGNQDANDLARTNTDRMYKGSMLGIAKDRQRKDNAADTKREQIDALTEQAGGFANGMAQAKAKGLKDAEGIYSQEYERARLKLLGLGVDLSKGAGRPVNDGKYTIPPEPGTIAINSRGERVRIGPNYEELDIRAPDPIKFQQIMKSLPPGASELLDVDVRGKIVSIRGSGPEAPKYDLTNAAHMAELNAVLKEQASQEIETRETQRGIAVTQNGREARRLNRDPGVGNAVQHDSTWRFGAR